MVVHAMHRRILSNNRIDLRQRAIKGFIGNVTKQRGSCVWWATTLFDVKLEGFSPLIGDGFFTPRLSWGGGSIRKTKQAELTRCVFCQNLQPATTAVLVTVNWRICANGPWGGHRLHLSVDHKSSLHRPLKIDQKSVFDRWTDDFTVPSLHPLPPCYCNLISSSH